MKNLIVAVAVLVSSIASAQDTIKIQCTPAQIDAAVKYAKSDVDLKKIEIELANLINAHRKSKGLSVLVLDADLVKASRIQSDYMASTNKCTHKNTKAGFETFTQRIKYFFTGTYGVAVENACGGNLFLCAIQNLSPAQEIFNSWKNSAGHNQNMLNPNINKFGLTVSRTPGAQEFYANFDAIDTTFQSVIEK